MKIRGAKKEDIDSVVGVHVEAFPAFFLTRLGRAFLKELYTGFLEVPGGVLLVATANERILGFAAGAVCPARFYALLRRKRGCSFLVKAIPALLRDPLPVLVKLFYALFYRGKAPAGAIGGALLSSIGVSVGATGAGIGVALLKEFEATVSSRGGNSVYLTTDATGNERTIAFYKKCGYFEECSFRYLGERRMIRFMKIMGEM